MESAHDIHSTVLTPDAPANAAALSELLIRDDPRLDATITDERRNTETIERLLTISLGGFLFYGAGLGLAAQFGKGSAVQSASMAAWLGDLPLVSIPLAVTAAFVVALLVCLPSFYFYTQLSGLDASFRLITAQALRVQARTAVLLLGALPVYAAIVLAAEIGVLRFNDDIIVIGVALPFIVGLAGLRSLYRSFARLATELGESHVRRERFLPRLVLAWGAVYSTVAPVAVYRLVEVFGRLFSA